MIDFSTVSREFLSLIGRRRELMTLLGSVFAGLGIFLQNTLDGKLPDSLGGIRRHVFAFYAILLMVPSLILALRMARLHAGLVLNGILIAKLSENRSFTSPIRVKTAAAHNYFGVSFLQFVLMDIIAGFSTTILVLSLGFNATHGIIAGGLIMLVWMGLYFRFHHRAARFALKKIADEPCGDFGPDEWRAHLSQSLEDANLGLNAEVAFVGLVVFSVFETLSGLGQIQAGGVDLTSDLIQQYGPKAYIGLMLLTSLMSMVAFLRIRVAVGKFSLLLDPTDRPFQPFKLTDSLLGFGILAFLFTVSLHLLIGQFFPALRSNDALLLFIDGAALAFLIGVEQVTLVIARRAHRNLSAPVNDPSRA